MVEYQPPEEAYEPNEPRASARADSRVPCSATADGNSGSGTTAPDVERFFCIYCGYDLTGHSGHELLIAQNQVSERIRVSTEDRLNDLAILGRLILHGPRS